jgi:hypothetical protein
MQRTAAAVHIVAQLDESRSALAAAAAAAAVTAAAAPETDKARAHPTSGSIAAAADSGGTAPVTETVERILAEFDQKHVAWLHREPLDLLDELRQAEREIIALSLRLRERDGAVTALETKVLRLERTLRGVPVLPSTVNVYTTSIQPDAAGSDALALPPPPPVLNVWSHFDPHTDSSTADGADDNAISDKRRAQEQQQHAAAVLTALAYQELQRLTRLCHDADAYMRSAVGKIDARVAGLTNGYNAVVADASECATLAATAAADAAAACDAVASIAAAPSGPLLSSSTFGGRPGSTGAPSALLGSSRPETAASSATAVVAANAAGRLVKGQHAFLARAERGAVLLELLPPALKAQAAAEVAAAVARDAVAGMGRLLSLRRDLTSALAAAVLSGPFAAVSAAANAAKQRGFTYTNLQREFASAIRDAATATTATTGVSALGHGPAAPTPGSMASATSTPYGHHESGGGGGANDTSAEASEGVSAVVTAYRVHGQRLEEELEHVLAGVGAGVVDGPEGTSAVGGPTDVASGVCVRAVAGIEELQVHINSILEMVVVDDPGVV